MSDVRETGIEGSGPRSGAVSGESEASREVRWSAAAGAGRPSVAARRVA